MSDAKFWNRMARRYARSPVGDEEAYRAKLAKTQEFLGPGSEVLELGCGTGTTAIHHAPIVRHIDCVDFAEGLLDIARQKARDAGVTNITFIQCAAGTYPVKPAAYDMVMAHSLLHLLRDRQALLGRIHDMLRPGGRFVSSTACLGDNRLLSTVLPLGSKLGLLPALAFFTEDELIAEVEAAGFEVEHRWTPKPKAAMFLIARKP
ncbi:class I SAM-dependent methyltransferase [Pelagovum pacificum]|nr:class I SAM-dependent methyltransferase [Pelagovum pacificum]QQA43345.1 class I SAM-dependent methyltransferase [Pelagovum pacificum]